jgi:hypothetical protein
MKILVKSAWGSGDPAKAAFAFLHGNALAQAGHDVQIFLLGEAVSVMRAGWLATAGGNTGANRLAWNPDPRLRGVLAGPWGPRYGPGRKERRLFQSFHFSAAHRVGR